LNATVQVSVCVGPTNNPCLTYKAFAVSQSSLHLQPISGTLQILLGGEDFQPVAMRVVDSSSPPHPVLGASVLFQTVIGRVPGNQPILWAGDAAITQPGMPVILDKSQGTVISDEVGVASFPISTGGFSGIAVVGAATAGSASLTFEAQQLGP
jgi:hypothetical protein